MFILKLWAKECPPFLQALHFCYGIGSFVAPLITGPFLKEVLEEQSVANVSALNENFSANFSTTSTKFYPRPQDIDLIVPFSVSGTFATLVSIALLFLYIKHRETEEHPSRSDNSGRSVTITRRLNEKVRMVVIILTSTFLLFYMGIEQTIGHLLPTYAHDGPPGVSKETAAHIAALFWVTYTCFRLVAIILSAFLGMEMMLAFNTIGTIIASIILCVAQTSVPAFWLAAALMGVALSSTWGSTFGFLEYHFALSAKIVATLTVGAAIGSSCTPALIGYLMGLKITIFAWFPLFLSIITAFLFLSIVVVCKLYLYTEGMVERPGYKSQVSIISQQSKRGAITFKGIDS